MTIAEASESEKIRSRLDHPVIDSDGHYMEFQPAYVDFLKEVGGADVVRRFDQTPFSGRLGSEWYEASAAERSRKRLTRPPWWTYPARNTLDRATATLPRLLYERLDQFGLDVSILYPSTGLGMGSYAESELRQAMCRALNTMTSRVYHDYRDRLMPVAQIPMHTPAEAIAELEHVVKTLGMRAVLMPSYVLRPRSDGQGAWYDNFCIDSEYDYDPVWAKCIELKVAPTFHSATLGLGPRNSVSNFSYNHIGHFAASSEALCKAMFIGGVTRRFPDLRMAFLEGGAAWACNLYSDIMGHWSKRNAGYIQETNPANIDSEQFMDLCRRYGGSMVEGRLADDRSRNLAVYRNMDGVRAEDPAALDDFARCGITRAEQIKDLFVPNFFFGCEADDPMNVWAFNNPLDVKLRVIFGSDIGHWDVPDMRDVTAEAWELVEDGHISERDFKDFVFLNPIGLWTHTNPDFFKGMVVEEAVRKARPA
jgi:predicted TIM-barrel fold metal-dependent hydrolase